MLTRLSSKAGSVLVGDSLVACRALSGPGFRLAWVQEDIPEAGTRNRLLGSVQSEVVFVFNVTAIIICSDSTLVVAIRLSLVQILHQSLAPVLSPSHNPHLLSLPCPQSRL